MLLFSCLRALVILVFGGTGLTIERFCALLHIYNCESRLGAKFGTVLTVL